MDGEWRTSYLHTGGRFRQREPELYVTALDPALDNAQSSRRYNKLREAFIEVDREHWGLLNDRKELNLRSVEVHEYGAGGQLAAQGHYDAGSLIT